MTRTDRPTITMTAHQLDSRWTGTATVTLPKGQVVGLSDVVEVLDAAGVLVVDVTDLPGGWQLKVTPSVLAFATLAQTCHIDSPRVQARGGPAGVIVPGADPAAVRHLDQLLGRDTAVFDREQAEASALAWCGGGADLEVA